MGGRERFLWLWKDKPVVLRKWFLPPTSLRPCNTATSTQCSVRFYLICVCAKGCYVNKGINSPRMIMHLILGAERGWEYKFTLFCFFLPLSVSWVLDHYCTTTTTDCAKRIDPVLGFEVKEKRKREKEKEKDSSLAFFSYKKRASSGRYVVSPAKYRSGVAIGTKKEKEMAPSQWSKYERFVVFIQRLKRRNT